MKEIRKIIITKVAAAAVAFAVAAPAVLAAPVNFTDMVSEQYAWAADAVKDMAAAGYINGYDDGTYRPDNQVTRQECLSLFARVMGSNADENKSILAIAHELYDDVLAPYSITWGSDEIVYLLYKGVLKETDLVTYLKNDEKSKPMSRYEAAIIITKAMGGEKKAQQDKNAQLTYTDSLLIPVSAVGYVKYASDQGILKGMDDGSFSPATPVTRAQIAVMLSRVVDKCDYSFEIAKLRSVNTNSRSVTAKDKDGKSNEYPYFEETVMHAEGELYEPDKMIEGVNAVFTFSKDKLIGIDAVTTTPDETIVGSYQGKANSSGKLYVKVTPKGESSPNTYECAADVSMMFDDSPATINSFTQGDTIEIELSDGKVESIKGTKKETKVTGATVTAVSINPELTVTISHADEEYDGMEYSVSDKVIVKKNNETSSMDKIYAGDRVTLTLEYGIITRIDATSTTVTKEGTIKQIVFSDRPTITVIMNGTEEEFEITRDCQIKVNSEEAELYDFRVGDKVTLTIESDAVKAIRATATATSTGNITGVITSINSSYGFINIDTGDGSGTVQTVFCSDNTTKFITTNGELKSMSKIKAGDTVQINGTVSNGAFVAKLVVILSEDTTDSKK